MDTRNPSKQSGDAEKIQTAAEYYLRYGLFVEDGITESVLSKLIELNTPKSRRSLPLKACINWISMVDIFTYPTAFLAGIINSGGKLIARNELFDMDIYSPLL